MGVEIHPAEVGGVPRTPTWSIQGDDLGCTIDSVTGDISVGHRAGEITVLASDPDYPECSATGLLLIVEDDATTECDPKSGEETVTNGSIDVWLSTGQTSAYDRVGDLRIYAEIPNWTTASPVGLQFYRNVDSEPSPDVDVDVIYIDGVMRQIKTPQMLWHINAFNYAYYIYLYDAEGAYYDANTGEYHCPGTALMSYSIINPNGAADCNTLEIKKRIGAQTLVKYTYIYSEDVDGDTWTLITSDGQNDLRIDRKTTSTDGLFVRHEVEEDGNIVYVEEEIHTELGWGRALTQRVVDPDEGGAQLTTTYGYNDGDEHTVGRLKWEQRPNGGWTWYTYHTTGDYAGRFDTVYSSWKDEGLPTGETPPENARKVVYEYSAVNLDERRPIKVTEYIEGTVVGVTEFVYAENPDGTRFTIRKDKVNVDIPGDQTYLSSFSKYDPDYNDRPLIVVNPDGRMDTFVYEIGTYDPATSPPDTSQFMPDEIYGDHERVTITHGMSWASGGIANKTTREVMIRDLLGRTIVTESQVCVTPGDPTDLSTGDYAAIGWTQRERDVLGRVTDVTHSDNTTEETQWSDCGCGPDYKLDRYGNETHIVYDALGRVDLKEQAGVDGRDGYLLQPSIFTDYIYDTTPTGLSHTTVELSYTGMSGSPLASYTETDRAGRTRKTHDQVGLETGYDYFVSPTSMNWTEITYPNGATQTTEYLTDGRVKRVYGDAVMGGEYVYGVNANGSRWTRAHVGENGLSSPRWIMTTSDSLGRVLTETRPAFGDGALGGTTIVTTYFYDDGPVSCSNGIATGGGRLWKTEIAVDGVLNQAPTLYEYSETGALIRTGLDVNGNGVLDLNGPDRVSETISQYVQKAGAWWAETQSGSYGDDVDPGSPQATTHSLTRQQLDGFYQQSGPYGMIVEASESEDVFGNITTATKYLDLGANPEEPNPLVTQVVDYFGTDNDAITVTHHGRVVSSTDMAQITTTVEYDGFGRRAEVTDERGVWSRTHYGADGRMESVESPGDAATSAFTTYSYYPATGPYAGKLWKVQNADGKDTYYDYNERGQITHIWGHVPQPVEVAYDDFGQRTSLKTYQGGENWDAGDNGVWPSATGDADQTIWTYDEATGLLDSKTYADQTLVDYGYSPDGKLASRTWARGLETTYDYYDGAGGTGQLQKIDYPAGSDTTDVEFTYTRNGELYTVTDAVGVRTFDYDDNHLWRTELFGTNSLLPDLQVRQNYDDLFTYQVGMLQQTGHLQRLSDIEVGTAADTDAYYKATYTYDPDAGRMTQVEGPGLPQPGVFYEYLENSNLLERTRYKQGTQFTARTFRVYEAERNLLASTTNKWYSATTVSKYDYANDLLGRRRGVVRSGTAFSAGLEAQMDVWGYNGRNELTDSIRYADADPANLDPVTPNAGYVDPGYDRHYTYDPIGNRLTSVAGDPENPSAPITTQYPEYCKTSLNQYLMTATSGTGQGLSYDADGNLVEMFLGADINRDGYVDVSDLGDFLGRNGACEGDPLYDPAADFDGSGCIDNSDLATLLGFYGTTIDDEIWAKYEWDAENRLIAVSPGKPEIDRTSDDKRLEFKYDYMGRRVEKRVIPWNPSLGGGTGDWDAANPDSVRRFVYHSWQPLLEYAVSDAGGPAESMTILRKYTWGLDLSQTLSGAGGIGGLLACEDTHDPANPTDDKSYYYFYDATGNVGQVIDAADGSIAAAYEYDPYGNVIASDGAYADENPFRFSTKWFDTETGLSYYGHRYYNSRLGRWINRDPIGEVGGISLYGFVNNNPIGIVDPFGLEGFGDDFSNYWGQFFSEMPGKIGSAANSIACFCSQMRDPYQRDKLMRDIGTEMQITALAASIQYAQIDPNAKQFLSTNPVLRGAIADFGSEQSAMYAQGLANAGQAGLNTLGRLSNTGIGLGNVVNYYGVYAPTGGGPGEQYLPYTEVPDFAKGAFYVTSDRVHNASIFAGEVGIELLSGVAVDRGISRLFSACRSTKYMKYGPHVEGPLPRDITLNFRGGSYTARTLDDPITIYRSYGGSATKGGSYWSRVKPSGTLQSQIDSALLPKWGNTAEHVATARIPKGTTIYEGAAAPQIIGDGMLMGGGNQVYILDVDPAWLLP